MYLIGILGLSAALLAPRLGRAQSEDLSFEKDTCALGGVAIVLPRNNTSILYPASAADLPLPIYAATDCSGDTKQVAFTFDGTSIGTDTAAPFSITYSSLGDLTKGQHTLTATAKNFKTIADTYKVTTRFNLTQAAATVDSDTNGLPNNPFTALPGNGYQWIAEVLSPDTDESRLAGVTRWAGTGGTTDTAPVVISLTDPDHTARNVIVTMPQTLLVAGETGILIVIVADKTETLLGATEADKLATEPIRGRVSNSRYVNISLIITTDGGTTFSEIANSRLAANPIHLRIEGVTALSTDYPAFFVYPTYVDSDATTGIKILAEEDDDWIQLPKTSVSYTSNSIETDLTALSLIAPFRTLASEGEGEGEGEGETNPCNQQMVNAIFVIIVGAVTAVMTNAIRAATEGVTPCFIATAAYGTPICHAIDTLRAFRDVYLLDNALGTAFVDTYYRVSPFIADIVARSPFLALCVRMILWPIIWVIRLVMAAPQVSTLAFLVTVTLGLVRRRKKNA
jgi:hypothetical protein